MQALRLYIRPKITTHFRSLIPVHPQPAHTFQDIFQRTFNTALDIGILNAQDKNSVVVPGKEPGK